MVQIELVRFAKLALKVSEAVLPKFSKRQFIQPQLLAVLCAMRAGSAAKPRSDSANSWTCGPPSN